MVLFMKKVKVGVDLGGSHIAVGAITNDGKILEIMDK